MKGISAVIALLVSGAVGPRAECIAATVQQFPVVFYWASYVPVVQAK